VSYYLSEPNRVPSETSPGTLVATIQHLGNNSIYFQSFLSVAGAKAQIELSLANSGAPEGGMVDFALALCKSEEERLNDSERKEHLEGSSQVEAAYAEYFFARNSDTGGDPKKPDEDVVNKLLQMRPDMPRAEIQRVVQGIDASGLQLDEQELEQLLKKVSKSLQVRRNIDAVRKKRLPYAAAVAAAE
jgi:hypothetical protein